MSAELNLAKLSALHAASTQGEWRYDGMHNEITTPGGESYWLIISECRSAPDQAQKEEFGHGFDANFAFIAAIHNAFPAILDRLEELEAYREAAEAAKPTVQALLDSGERAQGEVYQLRELLEKSKLGRDELRAKCRITQAKLENMAMDCGQAEGQLRRLREDLAARDARMKALGAAEWLEQEYARAQQSSRAYVTYEVEFMKNEAAQKRREAGE